MKKNLVCLMLVSLLSFPMFVVAGSPSERLLDIFSQYKSMQGQFKQVVSDAKGEVRSEFSGTFSMQKPGRFRWFIRQPNQQLIVINQAKLWIYDIDLEQVSIRQLDSADQLTPASFLSQDPKHLVRLFQISQLSARGGGLGFKLTPKTPEQLYQAIRLFFDRDKRLEKIQFIDNLGEMTTIQLLELKLNVKLPLSRFILKIPKGVDVIDSVMHQ